MANNKLTTQHRWPKPASEYGSTINVVTKFENLLRYRRYGKTAPYNRIGLLQVQVERGGQRITKNLGDCREFLQQIVTLLFDTDSS
jgi:hypothetical protein